MQRFPAIDHVVLGQDFKPVHGWELLEHRFVVVDPQAKAEAQAAA
jgi:hypothetical protein